MEATTSFTSTVSPLWNFTPSRTVRVSWRLSSLMAYSHTPAQTVPSSATCTGDS